MEQLNEDPPARVEEEGVEYLDDEERPRFLRRGFSEQSKDAEPAGLGRKVVDHFVKGSRLNKIGHVFEDVSELPANVRDAVVKSKGEREQAFYYGGKAYFNAKEIRSMDELVHAIAHEVIHPAEEAHGRALSKELGVEGARKAWGQTVDHIYKSFTKDIQQLYSAQYKGQFDLGTPYGRRKMVSEFLAEKHAKDGGKDPVVKKWYQRLAGSIRKMVNAVRRAVGMDPMKFNDEEVMATIKDMNKSYDAAVKSGEKFTGNGEAQYSRSGSGWARHSNNGFEVSTHGDSVGKQFSAFNAKLSDGRTIEEAYQVGVKGYSSIKEGLHKEPKNPMTREERWQAYKRLWQQWAKENPNKIEELRKASSGKVLTDKFAATEISQARALAEILQESASVQKESTAKSVGKWTRNSVEEDKDSLYIFTDNTDRTSGNGDIDKNSAYAKKHGAAKKYPMKTQAVIRGLDNAFPISTMKNFVGSVANAQKGMGQWQESDFDLFKKTIDEEIEDIKAAQERFYGGIKYSSGEQEADKKIGQGSISKLPPKLQEYLDNKLLEIGIDQVSSQKAPGRSRTIEIVERGRGEVDGMRGPNGEHMKSKGMKPGTPGWLGNPTKWEGNGGKPGVQLRDATNAFRADFLEKVEEDQEFREAVLALRGKKVGYYRPLDENHLQVIQEWLSNQPEENSNANTPRTKTSTTGHSRRGKGLEFNDAATQSAIDAEEMSGVIGKARFPESQLGAPHKSEKSVVSKAVAPSSTASFDETISGPAQSEKDFSALDKETYRQAVKERDETRREEDRARRAEINAEDERAEKEAQSFTKPKKEEARKDVFVQKTEKEKNKSFPSRLTEEQKAALLEIAEIPSKAVRNSEEKERDKWVEDQERELDKKLAEEMAAKIRRSSVRRALLANGAMSSIGPVVSIETPNKPGFKHTIFGPYDTKVDFGFFESTKAYYSNWRERIHHDIHNVDEAMKRMPPVAKVLYEKMLILERGLTIMSGKLSSEDRAAFDAALARVETEGADGVSGRIDLDTANQIVTGLKQAVTERGQEGIAAFLGRNPYIETMYRFSHFIRSKAIMRPGLTGQSSLLDFHFRDFVDGKLVDLREDAGRNKGEFAVNLIRWFHEDILGHLESTGTISSEQAASLRLENNTFDKFDYTSMPLDGDVDPRTSINFSRNALSTALVAIGIGGAMKQGMPIPMITTTSESTTELSDTIAKFHELKGKDPALDALTDSEFIVGILGMGQGRASLKSTEMDPRLANLYDISKLPDYFVLKMEKAGFIEVSRRVENHAERWDGYVVVDKLNGVLGEIRNQTFMKDMDQENNPRPAFYSGKQLTPSNGILTDIRTIRPGSIVVSLERNTFGVLGPVMENGEFSVLVPSEVSIPEKDGKTRTAHVLKPLVVNGKTLTLSKTAMAGFGYVHVPAIWDFVQSRIKKDGSVQAQNVFSWYNADAALNSKRALRHAAAETKLLNLDGMGHGRIVLDPHGRKFLALASQSGEQALLEVVEPGENPEAALEDAMLRLHRELRDAINSVISPDATELSAGQMKKVRLKVRMTINDLVASKQLSEAEAKDIREEMTGLYKAVIGVLPSVNKEQGPLLSKLYKELGASGFFSEEQTNDFLVMQEIMGATTELPNKGATVDGSEDSQQESSGFSNARAIEMMSDMGFSDVLRDLLGLNGNVSFESAYFDLKARAATSLREYRKATSKNLDYGTISRLHKKVKTLILALRAVNRGNILAAVSGSKDEGIKTDALKAARDVLSLKSKSDESSMSERVVGRMFDEIMNSPLPTSLLTNKASELFAAAPITVRGILSSYLHGKSGAFRGLSSMISSVDQFTLSSIFNTSHPQAKSLVLHILSVLSSMSTLDGKRMSMLAANVAYYRAIQDLPIKKTDGTIMKLSSLSEKDKALVKSMMASGGLYIQLINAYRKGNGTPTTDGGIKWADVPKEWPSVWLDPSIPNPHMMLESRGAAKGILAARDARIDATQSALGIKTAFDLPESSTIDVYDLALRLGTAEIPADAALMLEGLGPDDRKGVYEYDSYSKKNPELFLQGAGSIFLRPNEFFEVLDEAAAAGELIVDDAADTTWFEYDGVKYQLLSDKALEDEEQANKGVELRLENGLITGADYELLEHLRAISPSDFKFTGGRVSRDGRSPLINIRGELYPIDYKDKTPSSFSGQLMEIFRRLHDEAWTNDAIPEFERIKIREQMLAWEDFIKQHGKDATTELKRRGRLKQRVAKSGPAHLPAEMTEESEHKILLELESFAIMAINSLLAIAGSARPRVVIHGLKETALDMTTTAAGRRLLPASVLAGLSGKGTGRVTMTSLKNTMGMVTVDGTIHIYPRMHANATGQIDKVELARTIFHEAVGHVALKTLLGSEYSSFMLSVFNKHIGKGQVINFNEEMKIDAAEEWIAGMAERISYNTSAERMMNANIGTILDRVGSIIMRAYRKFMVSIGLSPEISKVEIRDLLRRAFEGSEIKSTGLGFIGPAMVPAENLPRYWGYKDYKPNLADRFLRNVTDRLRYWELLFRSKEMSGDKIRDDQHFMYAMRTFGSRIGSLTGMSAKLEEKFIKSFEGKAYDQLFINELAIALHTIERNSLDSEEYLSSLRDYFKSNGSMLPTEEQLSKGITEDDNIARVIDSTRRRIQRGTFNRATGYTTSWANKVVERAEALGLYKNGTGPAAESVELLLQASQLALGISEAAGMVSRKDAEQLRTRYKYFVPIPGASSFGLSDIGGFTIQGKSRFAGDVDTGALEPSKHDASNIEKLAAYTFSNLRQRIVEAEQNRTNQYILNFAMANPNRGVFTVFLHPDEAVGYANLVGSPTYDLPAGFEQMNGLGVFGPKPAKRKDLRDYEARVGVIPVYQNGILRHMRIDHAGLRASYERFMNPEKVGWAMKQLGKVNRWLIGVNTMFNPEFLIPNLARDFGAAMNTLAIQGTVAGIQGKTGTDFVKEFAPRVRLAMKVLYATNFKKDVSRLDGDAATIAGYIEEFQRHGGKIQWPFMESTATTMKNLDDAVSVALGVGTNMQKGKAFAGTIKDFMSRVADVFENATRLSAYVTARENGVSIERASILSREITVDFDRKGEIGQAINTLYLFANAGMQGSLVIARAIRNNPQRAARHLGGFIGLSFAMAMVNILMGGLGDDDEPNYFSIPEETRNGNMVFMLPFGDDGTPVRIPLPYGYAFFWALGQEAANVVLGRTGTAKATLGVVSSLLNNFNPLESAAGLRDAHGWVRLLAPTLVDPAIDIAFEQTAFGTPLMPEKSFDDQPDSTRHWRSVSDTSRWATRQLNDLFGGSGGKSSGITDVSPETLDLIYENVAGGVGKFLARVLKVAFAPLDGTEVGIGDIPVVRRFAGGKLNWDARGRFKENFSEIQGANRTFKNLKDNVNMAKVPELRARAVRDLQDFRSENEHLLAMRALANNVVSKIGDIDKRKERLYKSGISESLIAPKLRELDEQQREILHRFNKAYYEVIDSK